MSTIEDAKRLYESGLPMFEVAAILRVKQVTVARLLREACVPIRKRGAYPNNSHKYTSSSAHVRNNWKV